MPRPTIIIAQAAGSGAALATDEICSVLEPDTMLVSENVPVEKTGLEAGPLNRLGPANCVKPSGVPLMFNEASKNVPKVTLDAVPATPPNVPETSLKPTDFPINESLKLSGIGLESRMKDAFLEPVSVKERGTAIAGTAAETAAKTAAHLNKLFRVISSFHL